MEVEAFLWKSYPLSIRREVVDKLSWNETKCGNFSIRFLYASLTKGVSEPFPPSVVCST